MLKAVISQRLIETDEQGYKAVFEFLTDKQLQSAIDSIIEGRRFTLPYEQTIAGQKALLKGEGYEYISH